MRAMREHSRARDTTKAVGVAVASYAHVETGLSFPSNEELEGWGWADRTIQRALRRLEDLGELERVPEMENRFRPRVYRLPLAAQTSLLDAAGPKGDMALSPVTVTGDMHVSGDGLTRAREGTLEPQNPNPPLSPPDGGAAQTSSLAVIESPSFAALLSERAAAGPRRRRRRRRRETTPELPPASGRCPLADDADGAASERLISEWEGIAQRLRDALGEEIADIWFGTAHLHLGEDGRLELALAAERGACLSGRYRRILETLVGYMPAVVVCEQGPSS